MKNLKQKLIIVCVALITVFNASAQKIEKTNLWKIEGDDIKTSYLFGTLHIIPQKDFEISDKIKKAFEASERVALEIDMDNPNLSKEVMAAFMLPEGKELKSYMDEKEFKQLDDYLKEKRGVGLEPYNKFKPAMLMSLLMMTGEKKEPLSSYEIAFVQMAIKAKKEIDGLETMAEQLEAFDGDSYEKQIDSYIKMIEEPQESEKAYRKLLALYLEEDVDGMYDYMDVFMNQDLDAKKRFLDVRNNKWIPKITEYSKKSSVFYAVGGGHLGGEQGVIKLLRKKGYKVTPIF